MSPSPPRRSRRPRSSSPGALARASSVSRFELALVVRRLLLFGGTAAAADDDQVGLASLLGIAGVLTVLLAVLALNGFFLLQPNQAAVVTLLGRYRGTVRKDGWWWVNPLMKRQKISLRVRTFDSDVLKVNDAVGNPVEIASVINWQVADTAKAVFDVEDYEAFVQIQTEAAVRHVASEYPYDDYEEGQLSLRANADEVTSTLQVELQDRLQVAGVDGARHPPAPARLRPGDRRRDAAAPAGQRRRRRPPAHRRRRGRHGRARPRPAERARGRRARRGAQGGDGVEPARRPLQRSRRAARREQRHALRRLRCGAASSTC